MPWHVNYKKIGYITQKGLIERGWTYGAIDRFLGNPDKLYKNPRHKHPTYRYKYKRMTEAEETEEFQEWHESNLKAMSRNAEKALGQ